MARKVPDEKTVLVLQGGGALGAYQAGAFDALAQAGQQPHWVAGISIGAINCALIAGNPAGQRAKNLRLFWERISARTAMLPYVPGLLPRGIYNDASAASVSLTGVPGFFKPRFPPAAMMPQGTVGASSYYDTAPLAQTLQEMVDFDFLNRGDVRLSVGAVNVETGNMRWFDNTEERITPEHIMASGALPPGFPAIEIDGQFYWDGGLVSNTPLQYVLDEALGQEDLCVFQVDLFNAQGKLPSSVWTSEARQKDIRFSSRTRFNTDMMHRMHKTREAARRLYDKLPDALKSDPDAQALISGKSDPGVTIVHLIYRQKDYEHQSKDYEFSRSTMQEHWNAGKLDVVTSLGHVDWTGRHALPNRIKVFDLTKEHH